MVSDASFSVRLCGCLRNSAKSLVGSNKRTYVIVPKRGGVPFIMKKILMSLILCMFVVGVTSSAGAMVTTGEVTTQHQPNLVNLWSDVAFGDATWSYGTYWQSSDTSHPWAQWFTTGPYDVSNVTGSQNWNVPEGTELYLGVQECHYDWDTGEIGPSWNYGYYWNGEIWQWDTSDTYFDLAGGLVNCPSPVSIPTSVLLLGAGLLGLIVIRRRQA
jgi:hypothetical protein